MCSGRVDLEFILRAFSKGADGVLIGGCRLNECNYITHGNYDALGNVFLCKKIMEHIGLDPERLRIEFMSSSDGLRLVEISNAFVKQVKEIGPLGQSEGIEAKVLKLKLKAATQLVPYIKLVEREKLRAPFKSEAEYHRFFTSEEAGRLRLVEISNAFVKQVKEIGPLGQSEGIEAKVLKLKLAAATQLVPYIKLVEREKLRAPFKSEAEYHRFFTSDEVNRLIRELIIDRLSVGQILLHLKQKPQSTAEIATILGLAPSEVSRYMKSSSRQGLVRYDVSRKCYVLAHGG